MKSSKSKSSKLKSLTIEVFKNWSIQQLKSSKIYIFKIQSLQKLKAKQLKTWGLQKLKSWKAKLMKVEVFKIVVSKIEVFKAKALKNWNLQTKLNNFAFESNAEIRLESTFTTWWDKAENKARSDALKL